MRPYPKSSTASGGGRSQNSVQKLARHAPAQSAGFDSRVVYRVIRSTLKYRIVPRGWNIIQVEDGEIIVHPQPSLLNRTDRPIEMMRPKDHHCTSRRAAFTSAFLDRERATCAQCPRQRVWLIVKFSRCGEDAIACTLRNAICCAGVIQDGRDRPGGQANMVCNCLESHSRVFADNFFVFHMCPFVFRILLRDNGVASYSSGGISARRRGSYFQECA